MKFGGASVAAPECFRKIAEIIIKKKNEYGRIVVVVSAMANETENLISLAKQVHPEPPKRELDMLVSVGERVSVSLLAMALHLQGHKAISFTGSQSGMITSSHHTDARIVEVKPKRVVQHLEKDEVVIVAGFQGVSKDGEITTLGRGGSDTSAVALAIALEADKVEFYKDVPGIFDKDPKSNSGANFFSNMTYDHALEIVIAGAKVLHPRSILLAKKNQLPLHVRSFNPVEDRFSCGTMIGSFPRADTSPFLFEEVE